jgi:integrase
MTDAVDALRERIAAREDINEADGQVLEAVAREMAVRAHEFGPHVQRKYLYRGLYIAQHTGLLAEALEDEEAAREVVAWIHREYDNAETNKDFRVTLRQAARLGTDGEDLPESVEWVSGGYPRNYDPSPEPGEMYRWEEHIQPMLRACRNARDRALIAFAWDVGPRAGELFAVEVGDLTDHKYGMQVTLRGKTGSRSPIMVPSVSYVQNWLAAHPAGPNPAPGTPLWSKLDSPEGVCDQTLRQALHQAARRAEMTPPSRPTPTRFRKSAASFKAAQGVSQAHLEDHFGWSRGSDQAARYVSVFGEANEREIAAAHGVAVDADDRPATTQPCPRCQASVPASEDFCPQCHQALSTAAHAEMAETKDELLPEVVESPDPELRRKVAIVIEALENGTGIEMAAANGHHGAAADGGAHGGGGSADHSASTSEAE